MEIEMGAENGNPENEELFEPDCLCNCCAELEVWESKQHSVKYNVCFIRELLNPDEKKCGHYRKKEKTANADFLCMTCIRLERWYSKLYERKIKNESIFETKNIELCTAHHILEPHEINCNEYIRVGCQNNNTLCRSCTNLTVWKSKYKTSQAEICKIGHKILPLKYSCEYYKSTGSLNDGR
jgi:hypothetical protein